METGENPRLGNDDRRVLVVGGAGYIGCMLTRRLLAQGYRVRVLDNLLYRNGAALAGASDDPRFEFVHGDLCDQPVLRSSLAGVSDVVLLAALVGDPICKKYPELARKVNEDGAIGVFAEAEAAGATRFVFTSTCSNYGLLPTDELAREDAPLNPQSLYAETKIAVERHLLSRGKGRCAATVLRIATAFGTSERMRFDLTVSEFSRDLALGRGLVVYDENTWRPYCHVQDICGAVIAVLESPRERAAQQVFNVGSDANNFTKKMIVEVILDRLGVSPDLVTYKQGGHDPRNYRVAFDKIADVLGFAARYSVADGVAQLASAVRGGVFADADERRTYYGNYEILG